MSTNKRVIIKRKVDLPSADTEKNVGKTSPCKFELLSNSTFRKLCSEQFRENAANARSQSKFQIKISTEYRKSREGINQIFDQDSKKGEGNVKESQNLGSERDNSSRPAKSTRKEQILSKKLPTDVNGFDPDIPKELGSLKLKNLHNSRRDYSLSPVRKPSNLSTNKRESKSLININKNIKFSSNKKIDKNTITTNGTVSENDILKLYKCKNLKGKTNDDRHKSDSTSDIVKGNSNVETSTIEASQSNMEISFGSVTVTDSLIGNLDGSNKVGKSKDILINDSLKTQPHPGNTPKSETKSAKISPSPVAQETSLKSPEPEKEEDPKHFKKGETQTAVSPHSLLSEHSPNTKRKLFLKKASKYLKPEDSASRTKENDNQQTNAISGNSHYKDLSSETKEISSPKAIKKLERNPSNHNSSDKNKETSPSASKSPKLKVRSSVSKSNSNPEREKAAPKRDSSLRASSEHSTPSQAAGRTLGEDTKAICEIQPSISEKEFSKDKQPQSSFGVKSKGHTGGNQDLSQPSTPAVPRFSSGHSKTSAKENLRAEEADKKYKDLTGREEVAKLKIKSPKRLANDEAGSNNDSIALASTMASKQGSQKLKLKVAKPNVTFKDSIKESSSCNTSGKQTGQLSPKLKLKNYKKSTDSSSNNTNKVDKAKENSEFCQTQNDLKFGEGVCSDLLPSEKEIHTEKNLELNPNDERLKSENKTNILKEPKNSVSSLTETTDIIEKKDIVSKLTQQDSSENCKIKKSKPEDEIILFKSNIGSIKDEGPAETANKIMERNNQEEIPSTVSTSTVKRETDSPSPTRKIKIKDKSIILREASLSSLIYPSKDNSSQKTKINVKEKNLLEPLANPKPNSTNEVSKISKKKNLTNNSDESGSDLSSKEDEPKDEKGTNDNKKTFPNVTPRRTSSPTRSGLIDYKEFAALPNSDSWKEEYLQSAVDYAMIRIHRRPRLDPEGWRTRPISGPVVSEMSATWERRTSTDLKAPKESSISLPVPIPLHRRQRRSAQFQDLHKPLKPFLTQGSVAERVWLFECLPQPALRSRSVLLGTWRSSGKVQHKAQFWEPSKEDHQPPPSVLPLSRESPSPSLFEDDDHHLVALREGRMECSLRSQVPLRPDPRSPGSLPQFYFPNGAPRARAQDNLDKLRSVFESFSGPVLTREHFGIITKACGLPLFWKYPLFLAAGDGEDVPCHKFLEFWTSVIATCHDEASQFLRILTRSPYRKYLLPEDFLPLVQDLIDTHPGLVFLKEAAEFHSRYIHTVIARIYYGVNRSWSGKITLPELRHSDLLKVVASLEREEDINQVTQYFSYEHFYVIYCKFWELDRDHDLYISKADLRRHADGAISHCMIDRIFSRAVSRGSSNDSQMSYTEFVWFLLSEEDKRHPRSIEYWFRCMDLDGDGYLSMYELEYFYREQLQRMDLLGVEALSFENCLCQMLDMIKPREEGKISLSDLKRCRAAPLFFDTFFNIEKYLDHEQRDPFATLRDPSGREMSDWDQYAAEEYELLVAEENNSETLEEELNTDVKEKAASAVSQLHGSSVDDDLLI